MNEATKTMTATTTSAALAVKEAASIMIAAMITHTPDLAGVLTGGREETVSAGQHPLGPA